MYLLFVFASEVSVALVAAFVQKWKHIGATSTILEQFVGTIISVGQR